MVTLVTGHRGFLGSYVAQSFERRGWDVVGAGRPQTEIPSDEFDALLARTAPEVVVHCAGPASVPRSVEEPDADRRGSVDITAALLAALQARGRPPRLLLVSSAAVYGEPRELPVGEDAPTAPISPYGRHRLEAERLVLESGLPAAVARVFSAYGEGLRRQVLWDIVRRAAAGGGVELFGTGAESRDFVHASDVAEALATICERAAFEGDVVNVASGEETTVAELARLLLQALGVDGGPRFTGRGRQGDPSRWRADVTRLRGLGFTPSVPLEEGVHRYAQWAIGQG